MSSKGRTLEGLRAAGATLLRARPVIALTLILAWMLLIWTLSSQVPSGKPSTPLMNWLSNCAHAPLFGILALCAALLLPRERGWVRLEAGGGALVLVFVLAYGLVDELHQSHVPGRDATGLDVLTDLVGAACTLWIIAYVGGPDASEGGLWRRLLAGVVACGVAGALATWA